MYDIIVSRVEESKKKFTSLQNLLTQKEKEMQEIQDELKRIQGEYRVLLSIGQENGYYDEQGNVILNTDKIKQEE